MEGNYVFFYFDDLISRMYKTEQTAKIFVPFMELVPYLTVLFEMGSQCSDYYGDDYI